MTESMIIAKPFSLSMRAIVKTGCIVLMSLVTLLSLLVLVQQSAILDSSQASQAFLKTFYWSNRERIREADLPIQPDVNNYEYSNDFRTMEEQETTEAPEKIIKLLVLAYPRTGSSFTGDILSSSANASYIFEPLINFKPFGNPIDNWTTWSPEVMEKTRDYIENLFDCEEESIRIGESGTHANKHKNIKDCINSNPRVIKTIRLHKINMDPWIMDSDIKVVHLVRDPRAEFSSMLKAPNTWSGCLENMDDMCMRMVNDTLFKDLLPPERYFMLRYEDLMLAPISTLVDLYTQLKLDFDVEAADALYSHTRVTSETEKKELNKYYTTYRTADNDIYKWKKEMSLEKIRYVEESCTQFMDIAGYKVYHPPKVRT